MADRSGTIVAIGSPGRRAARRAVVRASLIEARGWIVAGLEGAVPLEQATAEAVIALGPAHREVLKVGARMTARPRCQRRRHLTAVALFGKESVCSIHPGAEVESIEDSRGWVAFQCEFGCWLGSILAWPA